MLAIIMGIIVTIFIIAIYKNSDSSYKISWSIIILFAVTTISLYFFISNIRFIRDVISVGLFPIYDKFVILLVSMSIAILVDGIFAGIIQKIYENNEINKFEKKYKTENYEYYRDILQTKSPAILSYCYNKKIKVEDEVVAILLNLHKNGVIKLSENKITILGDLSSLSEHEKYIFKKDLNNKDFKKTFKSLLIEDLEKERYVYKKNESEFNIVAIMEVFMVWMIIYMLVSIPIFMKISNFGILVFLAYFLTFAGVPIYKAIQNKINPVFRSKKALELSGKLKGLKRYIVDYSIIESNGVENINLYDEYIIYAVIFNIKGKLNKECKKIYRNMLNKKLEFCIFYS